MFEAIFYDIIFVLNLNTSSSGAALNTIIVDQAQVQMLMYRIATKMIGRRALARYVFGSFWLLTSLPICRKALIIEYIHNLFCQKPTDWNSFRKILGEFTASLFHTKTRIAVALIIWLTIALLQHTLCVLHNTIVGAMQEEPRTPDSSPLPKKLASFATAIIL